MIHATLALLLASLIAYALFGGADFGAGVLEAFLPKDERPRVDHALSPVWEANHVWLIAAIVIGFVGFPPAFAATMTFLHVPLSFALLGIVARGVAFTFRHYDPDAARRGGTYGWLFRISSALTPFLLGASLATLGSGRLTRTGDFARVYLTPWTGIYPVTAGLFSVALFTFVAAAWLATEYPLRRDDGDTEGSDDADEGVGELRLPYRRLARRAHLLAIVLGGATLVAAEVSGAPLLRDLLASPVAVGAMGSATIAIALVAWAFHRGQIAALRGLVGLQVACILGAYAASQYPALVRFGDAPELLVRASAAPEASLRALVACLVFALALVVPGLVALMRVYKAPEPEADAPGGEH